MLSLCVCDTKHWCGKLLTIIAFPGILGSVALLSQSVSTFKICTFKVQNWSEPHSMDSLGHQHWAISNCVESMLQGSLQFCTLKVQILKVVTLCESANVKQCYLSPLPTPFTSQKAFLKGRWPIDGTFWVGTLFLWKRSCENVTTPFPHEKHAV